METIPIYLRRLERDGDSRRLEKLAKFIRPLLKAVDRFKICNIKEERYRNGKQYFESAQALLGDPILDEWPPPKGLSGARKIQGLPAYRLNKNSSHQGILTI